MKKHSTILFPLALGLTMCACTPSDIQTIQDTSITVNAEKAEISAPTWKQHTEPVTLTMTSQITEDSNPPFHPPAWGEDAVSRAMMDLTGVKLDIRQQGFLNPPDIQVLASAGDLTDLVCVPVW